MARQRSRLPAQYYRDYDLLHGSKDYPTEVQSVIEFAASLGMSRPRSMVEIGCGTGNHTSEFLKRQLTVTAIDIDPSILEIAKCKLATHLGANLNLQLVSIQDVAMAPADLAVSLFNVMNYVETQEELEVFVSGVARCLRPGGVFIFDCWNGEVVKLDPPKPETKSVSSKGSLTLTVDSRGSLADNSDSAIVKYSVRMRTSTQDQSYKYEIVSRLWTIDDLVSILTKAGFHTITLCPWMCPQIRASGCEWKLMFGAVSN